MRTSEVREAIDMLYHWAKMLGYVDPTALVSAIAQNGLYDGALPTDEGTELLNFFEYNQVKVASGCTRIVLVPIDADFVIKIQYQGLAHDYGKYEYDSYQDAIRYGCDQAFAWCEACEIGGKYPVYIMQKCRCLSREVMMDEVNTHLYESWRRHTLHDNGNADVSRERYEEEHDGEYLDDVDYIAAVQKCYEFKVALGIQQVFDMIDWCIDIHPANIAVYEGRLVFIDYAGYMGSSDEEEEEEDE